MLAVVILLPCLHPEWKLNLSWVDSSFSCWRSHCDTWSNIPIMNLGYFKTFWNIMFHTYYRDKFQKVSSQSFTTLFFLLTCNYTSETARLILASDWPTNTKRVENNHTYPGSYMKLKVCSMIGRIWSGWKTENCWRAHLFCP
jgi:hypothetical protein